jgi:hypothetical protein
MGISMAYLKYLSAKGYLNRNTKLLDIGTSNLYNVTNSDVIAFTSTYGRAVPEAQANDLAIKSRLCPRKGDALPVGTDRSDRHFLHLV